MEGVLSSLVTLRGRSVKRGGVCVLGTPSSFELLYQPVLYPAAVNECDIGNGGCAEICNNTEGGFICSCFHGNILINATHCRGERQ